MPDPQLRCLLCDLILADDSQPGQPTEVCRQPGCGRKILAGQSPPEPTAEVLEIAPSGPPDRYVELETLPEAVAVTPPARGNPTTPSRSDEIPLASVVSPTPPPRGDVPTVQPRSSAAKMAPVYPGLRTASGPRKDHGKATRLPDPMRAAGAAPRPQVMTAIGVLGCVTVLIVLCFAVIAYALLYGLKETKKRSARLSASPTVQWVSCPG